MSDEPPKPTMSSALVKCVREVMQKVRRGIWEMAPILCLIMYAFLFAVAVFASRNGFFTKEVFGYAIPCLTGIFVAAFCGIMRRHLDSVASSLTQPCSYSSFLAFLGFLLAVLGISNALTIVIFINEEFISLPFSTEAPEFAGSKCGCILLLSMLMGLLGAVFFTANSLSRNSTRQTDKFDQQRFWGGFAFRMGESVLFVLVFFLLFCADEDLYKKMSFLPILSLLLGMFVKSGERLVFGIAERMFSAMEAFLPPLSGANPSVGSLPPISGANTSASTDTKPGAPRNLKAVCTTPAQEYTLSWESPLTGSEPVSYRVCRTASNPAAPDINVAELSPETTEFVLIGDKIDMDAQYYVLARNEANVDSDKSNLVKLQ